MDKAGNRLLRSVLVLLWLYFPLALAANGPSVQQLGASLDKTWSTFLKVTHCNLGPRQTALCMNKHHNKTIVVKLFGEPVNALILFETESVIDVSGPLIIQQSGFLVGPVNDHAYKIVEEVISQEVGGQYRIVDKGLKVFAHTISGSSIGAEGIQLNRDSQWLDGDNGPWIYHWSALSKVNAVLGEVRHYLKQQY